jgi:hypothetical protein
VIRSSPLVPNDESQQARKHEQAADRSVVELSPYPTHISPLAGSDRAKLRAAIVACNRYRPGRVLAHSVGPLTLGLRAHPSQCTFMVKSIRQLQNRATKTKGLL